MDDQYTEIVPIIEKLMKCQYKENNI